MNMYRFFILFFLNILFRYLLQNYISAGWFSFIYYNLNEQPIYFNNADVLRVVSICVFNTSNGFFLMDTPYSLNCFILYSDEDKTIYKIMPSIKYSNTYYNAYYSYIFMDIFPVYNNVELNIKYANDIKLLLSLHPKYKDYAFLYIEDVSKLTHKQYVLRIEIYNHMILCYEKYLTEHSLLPGNLNESHISFFLENYSKFSWFTYKVSMLLNITKFI